MVQSNFNKFYQTRPVKKFVNNFFYFFIIHCECDVSKRVASYSRNGFGTSTRSTINPCRSSVSTELLFHHDQFFAD